MDLTTYLASVKQERSDPTYLILKSHLKLEELMWKYLDRELFDAHALKGERLTFRQVLAISKAITTQPEMQHRQEDFWVWEALSKVHKLRNLLAHEEAPPDLEARIAEFVRFLKSHIAPNLVRSIYIEPAITDKEALFTLMMALYFLACRALGFDIPDGYANASVAPASTPP